MDNRGPPPGYEPSDISSVPPSSRRMGPPSSGSVRMMAQQLENPSFNSYALPTHTTRIKQPETCMA